MTNDTQIFRITVQVPDVEEASLFYSTLLGINGMSIRGSRYYFDCGPVILALLEPDDDTAKSNPDHIYFSVKDLGAVHARATKLGCLTQGKVHDEPAGSIIIRPWGERSFYVVDPYGNKLCFVDASTVFTGAQ